MRLEKRRNQRGIVLVAVSLFLLLMLAGLGLGIDLNRLLLAQQSLHAHAEAVGIAAVLELDGTPGGIERARLRAAEAWRRQVPAVGAKVTLEFGLSSDGPWQTDPLTSRSRAARVSVSSPMSLTLLRGVVGRDSFSVNSVARVEQRPVESLDARTLTATASLREILQSDTDPAAPSYTEYSTRGRGNGRRLLAKPDGAVFLLPNLQTEPAGGYLIGSRYRAVAGTGIWKVEVAQ
jgi:hypothetical protein